MAFIIQKVWLDASNRQLLNEYINQRMLIDYKYWGNIGMQSKLTQRHNSFTITFKYYSSLLILKNNHFFHSPQHILSAYANCIGLQQKALSKQEIEELQQILHKEDKEL